MRPGWDGENVSGGWSQFDTNAYLAKSEKRKPVASGENQKPSKAEMVAEKEHHRIFRQWLNLNNVGFIEAPMCKKSELPAGHPDFTCFSNGRCVFVEFKSGDNGLSEDQVTRIAILKSTGCEVHVSYEVGEAVVWTRGRLLL
jgi:hypothetical protein